MNEKDKPTVLLEFYLKKLRLPTMLREYASLAVVCREDRSDYPTYLLRLIERELLDREKRASEKRIKEAGFPVVKTIDTFNFKFQPSINEQLVRELLRGEYVDKKENVLLIGKSGTGKTHLACALAFAACAIGKHVRFYSVNGLVTELMESRDEKRLQRFQKQLQRLDLLVLDELGYVPFSKTGAELLFEVVSRAYEQQSLMVTSNLPFEEWTEVFGSERLTGALLDRITHRCHIIEAHDDSYRLEQAKKRVRQKRLKTDPENTATD
ncbi:IS21-like element helper ATPase IstB [Candidatus Bathyarchaeota archaeon]|nr:IS21-like element helper ATPase IstB [Candidatus Bathyarchaeota archaeon]